jgi:hypothetical protein
MNIRNLKTNLLLLAWHLQFMLGLFLLSDKYKTVRMRLSELLTNLRACVDNEDLCYRVGRKSDLSSEKEEVDKARDELVVAIRGFLKVSAHHSEDNVKKATNRVKIVFDKYNQPKKINLLSYDAETVAINNMLQELEEKNQQDIQLIGIENWFLQLKIKNNEFEQLSLSYNVQQSEKPTFTAAEARKETDAAYKEFVTALEGLMILEKNEPEFVAFAKELNTWIKHYNDLVAQHQGRLHADDEDDENIVVSD